METHKETLTRFSESTLEVTKLLKEGRPLSVKDYLTIEKNLLAVQLALAHHQAAHKEATPPPL